MGPSVRAISLCAVEITAREIFFERSGTDGDAIKFNGGALRIAGDFERLGKRKFPEATGNNNKEQHCGQTKRETARREGTHEGLPRRTVY
jgi:hypothetical protein